MTVLVIEIVYHIDTSPLKLDANFVNSILLTTFEGIAMETTRTPSAFLLISRSTASTLSAPPADDHMDLECALLDEPNQ